MSTDKQVTLEDREAAAMFAENVLQGWCAVGGNDFAAMRNGFWDDDDTDLGQILQAFAAHRIQSTRQLQADLDEALEALEKVAGQETFDLHIGYDSAAGGGNFVYADVIRTDDDAFRSALSILAKHGRTT